MRAKESTTKKKRKHKPIALKAVDFKLHIAIDFGTDGCALAFAYKDKVTVYNKWKVQQKKQRKTKTKTQLILNDKNEVSGFGDTAKSTYCNLSEKERSTKAFFERFKMSLYDNAIHEEKREKIDTSKYLISTNGTRVKSEIVFVAAFKELQLLAKKHWKRIITKEKITDDEIQWILTVPAIWSENAKYKMKKWIIKSGLVNQSIMDQCMIVYEPDCASLSIQKEYFEHGARGIYMNFIEEDEDEKKEEIERGFKNGDKYILIDAGGGTVDIVCHKTLGDGSVEEIVYPTGYNWGSCYIDDLYVKLLEEIFTKEWIDYYQQHEPAHFVEMIDNFQYSKSTFYKDRNTKTHSVDLPRDFIEYLEQECTNNNTTPEQRVKSFGTNIQMQYFQKLFGVDINHNTDEDTKENDKITLELNTIDDDDDYDDEEQMESLVIDVRIWKCLFDSKINPIISHIEGLLNMDSLKDCNYLCLVGGFSCSNYYQERMTTTFNKLTIIIPKKPMLSVVQGAAEMAINKDYIKARKLKYSYGMEMIYPTKIAKLKGISDAYIENHPGPIDNSVAMCFKILAHKNERIEVDHVKTTTGQRISSTAIIPILYSDKINPKVVEDGNKLAVLEVPRFDENNEIITEFHFYRTIFTVYSYNKNNSKEKKTAQITYVKY